MNGRKGTQSLQHLAQSVLLNMVHECIHCHKRCTNKGTLKDHQVLCGFVCKNARERLIDREEHSDLPSYSEMVLIHRALVKKYAELEEKVERLESEARSSAVKKVNAIEWVSEHVAPTQSLDVWVSQLGGFQQDDANRLLQSAPLVAFENVFARKVEKGVSPFAMVGNELYLFDTEENGDHVWKKATNARLAPMINDLVKHFLAALSEWRIANKHEMEASEHVSTSYNKALIKLMDVSPQSSSFMGKVCDSIGRMVKYDVRSVVEYVIT